MNQRAEKNRPRQGPTNFPQQAHTLAGEQAAVPLELDGSCVNRPLIRTKYRESLIKSTTVYRPGAPCRRGGRPPQGQRGLQQHALQHAADTEAAQAVGAAVPEAQDGRLHSRQRSKLHTVPDSDSEFENERRTEMLDLGSKSGGTS